MPETRSLRGEQGPAPCVAVVGAGFAGLSAALTLRRHRLEAVVFDGGPVRNAAAREVHGYLGAQGASAAELQATARRQATEVGARIVPRRIVAASGGRGAFELTDDDGEVWRASRVLLATGVQDRFPDIQGFHDFYGQSVHVCPHCDGYEWRDQPVAVITWTEATRDFALKLTDWSPRVTVVTDGRKPEIGRDDLAELRERGISVMTGTIASFEGHDRQLEALRFADGSSLEARAAFFSIGEDFRNELADQLGCELSEEGAIESEDHGRTSVDGVWAAGDVAGKDQFVVVAAAQGMRAAVDIYRSLSEFDEQPED